MAFSLWTWWRRDLSLVSLWRKLVPVWFLIPCMWPVSCSPHSFYKHLRSCCPWCSENAWQCAFLDLLSSITLDRGAQQPFLQSCQCSLSALSSMVASSCMRLLYPGNVALVAEELHLWFLSTLTKAYLNVTCYMWPGAVYLTVHSIRHSL